MNPIENKELRGVTFKNIIVTIVSTTTIVMSVMTTYSNLKEEIRDGKREQETINRVNEIRLKVLEGQVEILKQQVDNMRTNK